MLHKTNCREDNDNNDKTEFHIAPPPLLTWDLCYKYSAVKVIILKFECGSLIASHKVGKRKSYDFRQYIELVLCEHIDMDMILCRYILEHISDPPAFLQSLSQALRKGTRDILVAFEVFYAKDSKEYFCRPNDKYRSHFSPESLNVFLRHAGFEVLETLQYYDGACQLIIAHLARYPKVAMSQSLQNAS